MFERTAAATLQVMTDNDCDGKLILPPQPERPRDEECCGNECPLCVFTLYEREMEQWREQVRALRAAAGSNS